MGQIRKFKTGATRDTSEGKNEYEGFYHPLVIEEFGNYMTIHRKQVDGQLRTSDNWQKGIPQSAYMESLLRHILDLWFLHRGYIRFDKKDRHKITKKEALCAILFNVQGYLFEELKKLDKQTKAVV